MSVQLAHEEQFGLTVFQSVFDSLGRQGGINWHANMAGHHDRQVSHEPITAVLTHNGNLAGRGKVEALNVGGHLFGFGEELAEGDFENLIAAHGLSEEDLVGCLGAVVEDVVKDDLALFGLPYFG